MCRYDFIQVSPAKLGTESTSASADIFQTAPAISALWSATKYHVHRLCRAAGA